MAFDGSAGVLVGDDASVGTDAGLYLCVVIVRSLLLGQALVVTLVAWSSYRRPGVNLATLMIAVVESLGVFVLARRHPAFDQPLLIWADAGFAVLGFLALAVATTVVDRTSWVNWMCPLSYSVSGAAAVAMPPRQGLAAAILLAGTYLATVSGSISHTGSMAATAIANTIAIVGFFGAAYFVSRLLRRSAHQADDARRAEAAARAAAVASAERLAEERERNRQHRLLHDSTVQTLEAVAHGWAPGDDVRVQRLAAAEAARLRDLITCGPVESESLRAALAALVVGFAGRGLTVDILADGLRVEPRADTAVVLIQATSEALTNVLKHAQVTHAVVWAASATDGGVELVVRDHGVGFDPVAQPPGFGRSQSIEARLAEVGGTATVTSPEGRGTKVRLWVPS